MADRIFSGLLLAVILGYTYLAFTVIRAPFQYDPLGPESWPRLLGLAAIPCCLYILARPDVARFDTTTRTLLRLGTLVAMLFAYAWMFEPFGFIIATFLFCLALSLMLGARPLSAVLFGAVVGIGGYYLSTAVLDLNLPAGILRPLL